MAEAVIHGHNGLLFERGNIVDLTCQIRKIVNDHFLRQKLIDGIREVKSVEEETAELEETYQGLLSSLRKS
jgi:glycosyltransferase involved in cell wall biosynthesis